MKDAERNNEQGKPEKDWNDLSNWTINDIQSLRGNLGIQDPRDQISSHKVNPAITQAALFILRTFRSQEETNGKEQHMPSYGDVIQGLQLMGIIAGRYPSLPPTADAITKAVATAAGTEFKLQLPPLKLTISQKDREQLAITDQERDVITTSIDLLNAVRYVRGKAKLSDEQLEELRLRVSISYKEAKGSDIPPNLQDIPSPINEGVRESTRFVHDIAGSMTPIEAVVFRLVQSGKKNADILEEPEIKEANIKTKTLEDIISALRKRLIPIVESNGLRHFSHFGDRHLVLAYNRGSLRALKLLRKTLLTSQEAFDDYKDGSYRFNKALINSGFFPFLYTCTDQERDFIMNSDTYRSRLEDRDGVTYVPRDLLDEIRPVLQARQEERIARLTRHTGQEQTVFEVTTQPYQHPLIIFESFQHTISEALSGNQRDIWELVLSGKSHLEVRSALDLTDNQLYSILYRLRKSLNERFLHPAGLIRPVDIPDIPIEKKEELQRAAHDGTLDAVMIFYNWYTSDPAIRRYDQEVLQEEQKLRALLDEGYVNLRQNIPRNLYSKVTRFLRKKGDYKGIQFKREKQGLFIHKGDITKL